MLHKKHSRLLQMVSSCAMQNIYETTGHFSIRWLELDPSTKLTYHFGSMDKVHRKCIITKVNMQPKSSNTFVLSAKENVAAELCLQKCLTGYLSEDNFTNG